MPAGEGHVRAAFSPKEPLLAYSFVTDDASTKTQFRVRLWNGATRKTVGEFLIGGPSNGMSFSDDGQRLIIAEADPGNQISLWRVPEGTKLASYDAPRGASSGTPIAVAGDPSIAAHSVESGGIRVVDLLTREERWHAQGNLSSSLAFSPDAKILTSGSLDERDIRLWDVASGQEIRRLQGHGGGVGALVFWPEGKTLASGGIDQTIRLWDLTDVANVPPPRILRGHGQSVVRLALARDSTTLVSGSRDGSVRCWDTSALRREPGPAVVPEQLHAWRFGLDNKSVLVVGRQGRVAQWGGADFQEMRPLLQFSTNLGTIRGPSNRARSNGGISSDGRLAALGSSNGIVEVADLRQRALVGQFQAHSGPVSPLQFLSQGTKLVIRHADDGSLHEWDLTNWRLTRPLPGAPDSLFGPLGPVAFSPDERWCLTLGLRSASLLTDLTTGRESRPNLDIGRAWCAAYSPDGKLFAAGSIDRYVKVWETDTWQQVTTLSESAYSVDFSPDGKRLATGGQEGVKLWDLDSKLEVLTLEGFAPSAFSPDGNVLGSINDQGFLQIWRVPSWEEIEAEEKAQAK